MNIHAPAGATETQGWKCPPVGSLAQDATTVAKGRENTRKHSTASNRRLPSKVSHILPLRYFWQELDQYPIREGGVSITFFNYYNFIGLFLLAPPTDLRGQQAGVFLPWAGRTAVCPGSRPGRLR